MTQREFAKLLSVSQATISMALKDNPTISEELRKRVKKMAEETGYAPNLAGQLLRRGKNNLLGIIYPAIHSSYYSELLIELFFSAQALGYLVILENITSDDDIPIAIKKLKRFHVSGLLAESCTLAAKYFDPNIPTVFLDRYPPEDPACSWISNVYPDMYQAGFEMGKYLLATGKKKITFLGRYEETEDRFLGFCDACKNEKEIEINWLPKTKCSMEDGYQQTGTLLEKFPETEIILAHNDTLAFGAIRRLLDAGISVPEQIKVAGFDNIPIGKYFSPSLTTVGTDLHELASKAIETVTNAIKTPGYRCSIPVHCKMEIRESTGKETTSN